MTEVILSVNTVPIGLTVRHREVRGTLLTVSPQSRHKPHLVRVTPLTCSMLPGPWRVAQMPGPLPSGPVRVGAETAF